MRYCRFLTNEGHQYGQVEVVDGSERITRLLHPPAEDRVCMFRSEEIEPIPLAQVRLLAPVLPGKIVCVGRNYGEHAKELGNDVPQEPLLFLKPPSAVVAPGTPIRMPAVSERVDYEGELGVVIGKRCTRLADDADVRPYIRGYTCVNDVTARDLQRKDSQWTRAKGFDTFCPVGPFVADAEELGAALADGGLTLTTRLNGEVRQHAAMREMIFSVDTLLRYISRIMTLEPGDLIATGTPAGVAPMKAGDHVEVTVEGIGTLGNPVEAEEGRG